MKRTTMKNNDHSLTMKGRPFIEHEIYKIQAVYLLLRAL